MIGARTFLGWNAAEWTAIGTVALALLTLALAIAAAVAGCIAWNQLGEVRTTRELQFRPYVIVDIQPSAISGHFFNLIVENVGITPARDVRFVFDPPLQQVSDSGYPLAKSAMLTDGIRMLPPGRRITAFLDSGPDLLKSGKVPTRYEVTVSLSNAEGQTLEDQSYVIDVGYLAGLTHMDERGMHDAATALRDIKKEIGTWSHRGIRVGVHDLDEERQADEAAEVITGVRPGLGQPPAPDWQVWLLANPVLREGYVRLRRWRSDRREQPHGGDGSEPAS